jgi:phosphotransacetylase
MSTIFVLKPIIDALYNEMKEYEEKMEKRIKELEAEVASLKSKRKRPVVAQSAIVIDDSDDEAFAEAAQAPPTSSPATVIAQVEKREEQNENVTINNDDVKNVKMINGKNAKEYMKEYQRSYRKKQKDITLNL